MAKVDVSNDELRTVREAMRELNRMVAALESGAADKFVLCQSHKMRAVLLSVDAFAALRSSPSEASVTAAA